MSREEQIRKELQEHISKAIPLQQELDKIEEEKERKRLEKFPEVYVVHGRYKNSDAYSYCIVGVFDKLDTAREVCKEAGYGFSISSKRINMIPSFEEHGR